jgi:hypothetical protein
MTPKEEFFIIRAVKYIIYGRNQAASIALVRRGRSEQRDCPGRSLISLALTGLRILDPGLYLLMRSLSDVEPLATSLRSSGLPSAKPNRISTI